MMEPWREALGETIEVMAIAASGLELEEMAPADLEMLQSAKGLLVEAIGQLAEADTADARARALKTIDIVRETIAQCRHLDDVIAAAALGETARHVASSVARIALRVGAAAISRSVG